MRQSENEIIDTVYLIVKLQCILCPGYIDMCIKQFWLSVTD